MPSLFHWLERLGIAFLVVGFMAVVIYGNPESLLVEVVGGICVLRGQVLGHRNWLKWIRENFE